MAKARWQLQLPVAKVDDGDLMQVFGFLSVANTADGQQVLDSHGDVISINTLEKAAYDYNLEARGVGLEHQKTRGVGRLLESCVFTPAKKKLLKADCHEGWWVGFKIDDPEIWKRVKSGELKMLSIGGWARRQALSGEAAEKRVGKAAGAGAAPPEAHELLDLEIDEGSLVEAGANPEAHILLFKNAEKPVPLFEKTRAALKSLFSRKPAQKMMDGEGEEAPTTLDEAVARQEQMERWWKLRNAFDSVVYGILDSGASASEMGAKLAEAVQQFVDALAQDGAAAAKAAGGVECVDAALSAVLASGVTPELKEDLKKTLDLLTEQGNPAPRADKKESPMKTFEDVLKTLSAEDAALVRAQLAGGSEVQKRLDGMDAALKAATAKNEELSKELANQRIAGRVLEKAALVKDLAVPGLTTEAMTKTLVEAHGTELHDTLLKSWKATSEAVSPLMKQQGSSAATGGGAVGPASEELQRLIAPLVEKGMTEDTARASILSKNLSLAKRVGLELRGN